MKTRLLSWGVVLAAAGWVAAQARPAKPIENGMQIHEFGRIPIVYKGRTKPVDSLARVMLRIISERETYVDEKGQTQPAIRWLLDVMTAGFDGEGRARGHKVLKIVDEQLLGELKLEKREGYRYAITEFVDPWLKLQPAVMRAQERDEARQTLDPYERHLLGLGTRLRYFYELARGAMPHAVPPSEPGKTWETLSEAFRHEQQSGRKNLEAHALVDILEAYAAGETAKFNEGVAAYLSRVEQNAAVKPDKIRFEAFFNRIDPFAGCKLLYLVGLVLGCAAWLIWEGPLRRTAHGLLWFTWIVHTVALVSRIYISGRPPVTNLYSSAVFIGWACAFLGLVLERAFRLGVGNTVAAVAGFATLLIAPALAADGDTMEVLQAVLDTQFWLATHVVCITLGYATTYVTGLIGILYILRGVLTRSLTPEVGRNLIRMLYGCVCFATFFSFVGTVLGGLWADDSWGRFWGWDPKENGALIIVLWNVIILHARWGGLARERGLATLAVFGNVVVSWSYFGVNLLSKGLHNYGFMEGHQEWLVGFVVSQLLIIGLGLLPMRAWRSFADTRFKAAADPE